MRRYIQGDRKGREANRIERQAMRDPFLAEALEGYEKVKGDPSPHIDILRRRIRRKNQRRLDVFKYGGMAASFLFIIAFSVYFGLQKKESPEMLADQAEHSVEENIIPAATRSLALAEDMADETEEIADQAKEMTIRQEARVATPSPVDGWETYKKYIEEKLIRPSDETDKEIKGEVTLSFFINEQGKPYRITVKKPLSPAADKEACRLIEEGPLWTIGSKEVFYTIVF
ncbi:hypothetical protein LJB97_03390 [Parabacteroides sp. OttesenSCG-928-O15]|nr:hypothetical protein [Parabacteroides sp. OttesenSCG-928-O15]